MILNIDDDSAVRTSLMLTLKQHGYQSIEAATPKDRFASENLCYLIQPKAKNKSNKLIFTFNRIAFVKSYPNCHLATTF